MTWLRWVAFASLFAIGSAYAKGGPAPPAAYALQRDSLIRSTIGPLYVQRGQILLHNPGQQRGDEAPVTLNSSLTRGTLARPHTVLGFALPAGTQIQLGGSDDASPPAEATFSLRTAGSVRYGGVAFTQLVSFAVTGEIATVSGIVAEPAVVDGVPLRVGTEAGLRGSPAALQSGDVQATRLGFCTVAQKATAKLGAAVVPLEASDRISMLKRHLDSWPDGTLVSVWFAQPRTLEGRFPAQRNAVWNLRTGKLVRFAPATPFNLNGIQVRPSDNDLPVIEHGAVTFYDSGELRGLSPLHEVSRHGLRLGAQNIQSVRENQMMFFWPNGEVMCADSIDSQFYLHANAEGKRLHDFHYVTVYFDPQGTPRLATFSQDLTKNYFVSSVNNELHYRETAEGDEQHVWPWTGECMHSLRPEYGKLVSWLQSFSPVKNTCTRNFSDDTHLRATGSGTPMAIAEFLRHRPTAGTFTVDGYAVFSQPCGVCPPGAACKPCDAVIVVSATRNAGIKQGIHPDYDLWIHVPLAERFKLFSRYRITFAVCDNISHQTSRPTLELRGYSPLAP